MSMETVIDLNQYRLPSTSEEILGLFLKYPEILTDYKRKLNSTMFPNYKWLYESMIELDKQKSFSFKAVAMLNQGYMTTLHDLRNSAIAPGRLPNLIEKLKKESLSMDIANLLQSVNQELIANGRDPNEVLSDLHNRAQSLQNTESTDLHDPERDIDSFFKYMEEIIDNPSQAYGILTGIPDIDIMTTGFHKGDFIVVGARTSIGKSAFVIDLALRMNAQGNKIAIYSLEMSKKQIYMRMLSNLMSIDLKIMKTGRMSKIRIPEMKQHKEALRSIYIDDTRGITADYITDSMRRVKRERGLDIAIVDYIQDVKENGENNDNGGSALSRVCRKLRKGAQDFDCPVIGLSQVNRNVEERKDKRPMASDLTGSAGIESSADVIALLYREDYYDPNHEKQGIMEVNFAKQRNGETGRVEMFYERKYQQLRPLSTGKY